MDLTSIFCAIDDYCTQQKINWNGKILSPVAGKRNRKFQLSLSEVATIVVYFHLSHYREFKNYYLIEIKKNLKSEFPKAVSYNRFVELMPNVLAVIASFLSNTCMGNVPEYRSLILQFSKYATTEESILIKYLKTLHKEGNQAQAGFTALNCI
ncbi:hypothetical protein LEP1GSC071_1839 [Leptospira santarosai str. JET]|nr:hypothetical protein LEP1GSC071_1839 [Leptospira santarosai str. JET]